MIDAGRLARENMTMSKRPLSFEQALARLEKIANQIEKGEIGLEESMTRYEEGMVLVQQCREILSQAEQRIIKLQPDDSGGGVDDASGNPT